MKNLKKIIHVDMDYFYAQVEELDRPELKTQPVAIGGIYGGRGVLATCNYVARKYGIKSAMPTALALKKCPHLVLIKPSFDKYRKISKKVFSIFAKYTEKIQSISLDEAYLDVTGCVHFDNDAQRIAKEIKKEILAQTGLTASAGVSYNKLLAKIGSELFKPDGLAILRQENIEKNISHFPVSRINGVGKVTQSKMRELGIESFGDLQKYSKLDLVNYFGSFGPSLYNYCRGIDLREVEMTQTRKSLSVEKTFQEDLLSYERLLFYFKEEYRELSDRLLSHQDLKIKSIFIKIKFHDFTVSSLEKKIELNYANLESMFEYKFKTIEKPIRLLGLGVRFYSEKSERQLQFPFIYNENLIVQ